MENLWLAFGLTLFAGLSTGIGSIIAFFVKKENKKFLSISLGFSAGVMIYVSMIELFAEAKGSLIASLGESSGYLWTIIAFFIGIMIVLIIDKLIPEKNNPHEVKTLKDIQIVEADIKKQTKIVNEKNGLYRTGMFTALALAIHNFPEGLAAFVSALYEPSLGIAIAIAIAIHNIPEGIAVSVPIYYATGNRKKAFLYSFLSGLAEPIGAIVGYLILGAVLNKVAFGIIFAMIAGIMVFISLDELLPSAREYGEHHLSIYGLVAGMFVMAISLWLL